MKFETHYTGEASENERGKVLKENPITDRYWSASELFVVQNNTENAYRCVHLTVENV